MWLFRLRVTAFRTPKFRPCLSILATILTMLFSPVPRDMKVGNYLIGDLSPFLPEANLVLIFLIRQSEHSSCFFLISQLKHASCFQLLIEILFGRGFNNWLLITLRKTLVKMDELIEFLLIEFDGWVTWKFTFATVEHVYFFGFLLDLLCERLLSKGIKEVHLYYSSKNGRNITSLIYLSVN
jgi:hypothetical protein